MVRAVFPLQSDLPVFSRCVLLCLTQERSFIDRRVCSGHVITLITADYAADADETWFLMMINVEERLITERVQQHPFL